MKADTAAIGHYSGEAVCPHKPPDHGKRIKPVCNDFGNHIPYSDYLAAFGQTRITVRFRVAEPGAARGHLADRQGPDHTPPRRRDERVQRVALGLSTSAAQRPAGHQLSLRGTTISGWPLPRARVAFLRVHRQEIAVFGRKWDQSKKP
jgi:hypothetical protein